MPIFSKCILLLFSVFFCLSLFCQRRPNMVIIVSDDHAFQAIGAYGSKLIRFYKRVEGWELYDLKKDKGEMKNVSGSKKYRKVEARLKQQLSALIQQYEDEEAERLMKAEPAAKGVKTF